MEHERKFLIDGFPEEIPMIEKSLKRQSYLSINPEVRVREKKALFKRRKYSLTLKGEGLVSRPEVNKKLTRKEYLELISMISADPIVKDNRKYQLESGHVLECSHVDPGTLTEFMYAEIEFNSAEEAEQYQAPEFLGRDVTKVPEYKMKNYWKRTR